MYQVLHYNSDMTILQSLSNCISHSFQCQTRLDKTALGRVQLYSHLFHKRGGGGDGFHFKIIIVRTSLYGWDQEDLDRKIGQDYNNNVIIIVDLNIKQDSSRVLILQCGLHPEKHLFLSSTHIRLVPKMNQRILFLCLTNICIYTIFRPNESNSSRVIESETDRHTDRQIT